MPEHLNLPNKAQIFKTTYQQYLKEIKKINMPKAASMLGLRIKGETLCIEFFNREYHLKENGFFDDNNKAPSFDVLIVLCKYLLLCPDMEPEDNTMVSFRELKDSGPLAAYFASEVEALICSNFEGKLNSLEKAASALNGVQPEIDANYDFISQMDILPKLPIVLLFNDKDEEFEAQAKLLFEQRAEKYLDAECLAIVGNLLSRNLDKEANK